MRSGTGRRTGRDFTSTMRVEYTNQPHTVIMDLYIFGVNRMIQPQPKRSSVWYKKSLIEIYANLKVMMVEMFPKRCKLCGEFHAGRMQTKDQLLSPLVRAQGSSPCNEIFSTDLAD